MKHLQIVTAAMIILALYACTTTSAANPSLVGRASIPFVDHGGIQDWRAVSEKAMLIKARHNQWYRATFRRRCFNLDDSITRTVSFIPGVTGSFGEHSEVLVDDQRCRVKMLEKWLDPDEAEDQDDGRFVSNTENPTS